MLYFPLISTNMYSVTYRVLIILPSAVYLACKNKCQFNPVTGSFCFFDLQHWRTDNTLVWGAFKTTVCLVLFSNTWLGSRQRHHTNCLLAYFSSLSSECISFFPDLLQALTLIVAPFRLLNVF